MFTIDEHIGRRVEQRRRKLQMTQGALGDAVGVRFQQIGKYECAANRMSAARLWAISQALGVPVGYFFEGCETAPIPRQSERTHA